MISIDTNILVRVVTGKPQDQAEVAQALLANNRVFIPVTVLLETEWVLRRVMGFKRPETLAALQNVARLPDVVVESSSSVADAFRWAEAGLDFADALHLARSADCTSLATFDLKLVQRSQRMGATPPALEP